MSKLAKNITTDNYQEALATDHEKMDQILPEVLDDFKTGRYAILLKKEKIDEYFPEIRNWFSDVEGITLKIFLNAFQDDLKEIPWAIQPSSVFESTIIQNRFAEGGLAPKVYGLIEVEDNKRKYLAQITKDIGDHDPNMTDEQLDKKYDEIVKFAQANGFSIMSHDKKKENIINGQWIDFQDFVYSDHAKKKESVRQLLIQKQLWQNNTYQSFEEFGVKGIRGKARMTYLESHFYKNKPIKVLDLGCSGGAICNFAAEHGASRVIGVDFEEVIIASQAASNYLGNFQIDYYGYDLKDEAFYEFLKTKGHDKFDLICFLSMEQHVGLPRYLSKFMHDESVLLFESNCYKPLAILKPELEEKFKEQFSRVEHLADINDLGARAIYKLMK